MGPYRERPRHTLADFQKWMTSQDNRNSFLRIAGIEPPHGWHQSLYMSATEDEIVYRLMRLEEGKDSVWIKQTIPFQELPGQLAGAASWFRDKVHDAIVYAGSLP